MTYTEEDGISLVLKGPSKVSIASYLSLGGGKSFLLLVLVLIRLYSSSSEDGVKYLASSLTLLGPILRLGSWDVLQSVTCLWCTGVTGNSTCGIPCRHLTLRPCVTKTLLRIRGEWL